jgi:hypothetical protein
MFFYISFIFPIFTDAEKSFSFQMSTNHVKAGTHTLEVWTFQINIKADIRNPLRYLLITLKPLRGPSVGVQPPTDAEKSLPPLKKRGTFQIRLNPIYALKKSPTQRI